MQPPQAPPQLAALGVQADAAAAAARRCLAEAGTAAGAAAALDAPLQPAEQAGFRRWFLPRFADCYAAEVEALQDSEPPIPAGVLLQCVRLAADGDALFSPALKRLVLSAGDAA
ncbi:lantibiotic dehydratase [Micractinium conductrix]|uniref:Lantibiotic dehydratase n=1 Tax=Micractinium conductrix TaxID=554055 RepID=A0A2P6VPT1_9CHLO|nr:lantibiotic dehydratase [Micractinium conductrix]|eukprot:PSC76065.1 lantibiotic dehydratase [Micractinium conductrix]